MLKSPYDFNAVIDRRGTLARKWDALAVTFGSEDLLPMWIADMDFEAPPAVVQAVKARAAHGVYGYPTRLAGYYQSIVGWQAKRHNWKIEREWLLFSPGVVSALAMAVQTFTDPGDSIIIQPPVYPPFFSVVRRNNRKIVENPLQYENGRYAMDIDDLANKAGQAKMLILCSPHNPVGRVWTREELTALGDICVRHNLIIVVDEIHCDLLLNGRRHIPLATVSPELAARTITCVAPSKTFNIAGLYTSAVIISDEKLRRQFNEAVEALDITGGNLFGIVALEAAYRHGEEWLEHLLDYLTDNAAYLVNFFEQHVPAIKAIKPESTYLAWLDCRGMGMSGAELKEFFIRQAKVGLNDGTTFGSQGEGFMRLNFGCSRATLEEGLARIAKAAR